MLTTMNVQHVESLNDQIWQSTGVRVRETVPDWVVKQADDVVMVDLTPRALLNRLERGVVYPPDRARVALQNFFREPTLVALRELAMRQTAYSVESRQHPQEFALTVEMRTSAIPDGAGGFGRWGKALLADYERMDQAPTVPHADVVAFVRDRKLYGRGIGWIDVHLLAAHSSLDSNCGRLTGHGRERTGDQLRIGWRAARGENSLIARGLAPY